MRGCSRLFISSRIAEISCPGLAFSPMHMCYSLISMADIYLLLSNRVVDFLPSKS